MQFLADEMFPRRSVQRLRMGGYDVASVAEDAPGSDDWAVFKRAEREGRIILTFDVGFSRLVTVSGVYAAPHLVLFQLRGNPRPAEEPAHLLMGAILSYPFPPTNMITTISRSGVMQQPIP